MKLLLLFMFAGLLHVSAASNAQTITLHRNYISLAEAIKEIRKQTDYEVNVNAAFLKGTNPISIQVVDLPLASYLKLILKDQPLQASIADKTIVFSKKSIGSGQGPSPMATATPTAVIQQAITLRITDAAGAPLARASVFNRNSSASAATDQAGLIRIPAKVGDVLEIRFLGHQSLEYLVKDLSKEVIQIQLTPSLSFLEEVAVEVNTGFQSLNKERATGAFGQISSEQLEKPARNISQRLIGQVAGLQARKLDVNGNPSFEIRGQSSLNANASPLVIVDGFPIQGDFSSINPNNVESVTVLKDAAAASIWGARSANGVIVITTKNASQHIPLRIEASAFTRIGSKFDLDYVRALATSEQTIAFEKKAYPGWYIFPPSGSIWDVSTPLSAGTTAIVEHGLGNITEAQRDAELQRLAGLSNAGQISEHLLANPINSQFNVNFMGSSGKMSNALSLLYEKNQSNFKETDDQKYMLNFRSFININRFIDFTVGGMMQYQDAKNNGVSLTDLQNWSPYDMLLNPDGSYNDLLTHYYGPALDRFVPKDRFPYSDWTYNPIVEINNRKITAKQLNTRIQGGLTIKIIPGLSLDSKGQYELFNTFNRSLYSDKTFRVRDRVNTSSTWMDMNDPTSAIIANLPKGSILDQNRFRGEGYNFRNQLNFNKDFALDHRINAVLGTELSYFHSEVTGNPTAYGYNDETLQASPFPNGPGNTPTSMPPTGDVFRLPDWLSGKFGGGQTFDYLNTISNFRTEKYFSIFTNLAYTYKNKYTLSGSYRTDASNMISEDPKYRYAPFWSVGGSWQVSKEDFFQNDVIDRLTARLTYGFNGNVDRTTSFIPLISMRPVDPFTNFPYASISSYGNPTLRWEKTGTWNFGLDFGMFQNKLFGGLNLYNKKGKDLLATIAVSSAYGTTSVKTNNAAMTNRGIELELGTVLPITKDLRWMGNFNFSYNHNQIDKLFVLNYDAFNMGRGGSVAYVEGMDANTIWSYEYASVKDGEPVFYGPKDANGEKTTYTLAGYPPGDARDFMLHQGTQVAPYSLGFSNTFSMANFDLSFILTGKFGHVFRRQGFNYPFVGMFKTLPNSSLGDVMNGDPEKIIPLPTADFDPGYFNRMNFAGYMDYLVAPASHIRLQEVMLAYNFPSTWLSQLNVAKAQVFAQGTDLCTWLANDYKEDPEYPKGFMKPQPKFTFGVRIEL